MNNIIEENKVLLKNLNKINKNIINENNINELKKIKNYILKFDTQYKQLYELINICKDINENNKELFNNNLYKIKNKIKNNKIIEKTDMKNVYIDYKPIINKNTNNNNILKIPVIYINDKSEMNNSPIYYIKSTDNFGIKINNNIIIGNIGNIYNKKDLNKVKIKKCTKQFCNKEKINCSLYHNDRNFMNYSWNYSNLYKTNDTKKINGRYQITNNDQYNTRILGSKDTLMTDIIYTNNNEKELRNSQLMHDILIYQILNNYLNETSIF